MGGCCAASRKDFSMLIDLPEPSTVGVYDKFALWEYKTAFKRTPFLAFKNAVNQAEKADGEQGFVTLNSLSKVLITAAWADLSDPESSLSKMLLSPSFKNAKSGQTEEQIDKDYLILFGLLHCIDSKSPFDKSVGLYEVLQDGGLEKHERISAGDKDFKPTFYKLCSFATSDIFKVSDVEVEYSDDEVM